MVYKVPPIEPSAYPGPISSRASPNKWSFQFQHKSPAKKRCAAQHSGEDMEQAWLDIIVPRKLGDKQGHLLNETKYLGEKANLKNICSQGQSYAFDNPYEDARNDQPMIVEKNGSTESTDGNNEEGDSSARKITIGDQQVCRRL
ncbi:hypothetical protein V6N13_023914 [Hibiscus sabdariffa]